MKKALLSLMVMVSVLGAFGLQPVSAADEAPPDSCSNSFLGLPTWHKYLTKDSSCTIVGPSKQGSDQLDVAKVATRVALAVIDILLRVGGMVAFAFIVISGFKFTLSQGNPDQEKAARETAINAVIGMVITIFAVAIVSFIGDKISS
jgi:hypothetical protein